MRKRLNELKGEFNSLSRQSDPKRWAELKEEIRKTKDAISEATGETEKMSGAWVSLSKMKETLKGVFFSIGAFLLTYVVNGFKQFLTTIIDFEKANSRLAAVLGSTKAGIKDLTDEARRLGATTSYTAAQVTSLQIELAKLGFAKEKIKEMTPAVLKFAKAVDTDLGSAAAFAGASMRIFGKEASEVEEMLATLAIGTTKSALNFSFLQSAMSTVGPVAASFGFSVEETTSLLGALANAGFDASTAATATRNILLNLADSNGKLAQALGQPVNNLGDLVAGLQKLTAEGIDLNAALELTDKRSVSAFSRFLAGADTLTSLQAAVSDCTDQFNAMSEEMGDNVSGALAGLQSAVEGVVLAFYESRGPLKWVVDKLASLFRSIEKGINYMGKYSGAVYTMVSAFVAYRVGVILSNTVTKAHAAWIALSTAGHKLMAAAIHVSALTQALFARNTALAKTEVKALWVAIKGNPLGLALAVVTALVVGIYQYVKHTKELAAAQRQQTAAQKAQIEAEKKASESYAEQKSKLELLIATAKNEKIAMDEREKAINRLNRIIPGYNAQIDKTTGKYKASAAALNTYLASLEKKLRYEANEEEWRKLIKKQSDLKQQKEKADADADAEKRANEASSQPVIVGNSIAGAVYYDTRHDTAQKKAKEVTDLYDKATADVKAMADYIQKGLEDGTMMSGVSEAVEEEVVVPVEDAAEVADDAATKLKKLNTEIKSLQKQLKDAKPGTDVKALAAKIKLLQSQRKELLGTEASKRTPGTYQDDSLKKVTAPIETEHLTRQQSIDDKKSSMTAGAYARATAEETKRYAQETIDALTKLRASTAESHDKTLDEIDMQLILWQGKITKAQAEIDKSVRDEAERGHNDRMKQLADGYKDQERAQCGGLSRDEDP